MAINLDCVYNNKTYLGKGNYKRLVMKKVLLVDTNVSSAPIYNYLVQEGYDVYVIGGNKNDYLAKSIKNYIEIDYSDVDKTRELINSLAINYIVPGCNDRSYLVCSQLNSCGQFYGLDSLETSETLNNKQKFREFANKIGLPVPPLINKENIDEEWPVIVKPVDAFSGRGVTVIHKTESHLLTAAINCAKTFSQSNSYLVEKYVEGQLFSHTAFIAGQQIVADFVVKEHGTANPFVVDTSRVDYDFPEDMLARIRASIEMMAKSLSLVDGLIHTQFIKKEDDYWLIEITRRCPGDLYSQLIELSTSYRYVENYTRPFINRKFLVDEYTNKKSWIMRHTLSQATEGFFGSIQFLRPLLLEKMVPISVAGDYLKASPFGRVGILFAKVDAKDQLDNLVNMTLKRNLYVIHHQKDSP